jgi:hypothetical protein
VKLSLYLRKPLVSEISHAHQNGQSCSPKEQLTIKMTIRPVLMTQIHPNSSRNSFTHHSAVSLTYGLCCIVLINGEPGHDIIPELYPQEGEPVIDKSGKGSFYATNLDCVLKAKGITVLFVCGVSLIMNDFLIDGLDHHVFGGVSQ